MARLDGEDQDAVPTRPLPDPPSPGGGASAEAPTEQLAPHVPVADLATTPMAPVLSPAAAPGRARRMIWPWVLLAVVLLAAILAVVVGMNLDDGDHPLVPASPTPTPSVTTPAPAPDATVPETPDQAPDDPPPTQEPTTPPADPTPDPTGTTSP